MRVGALSGTLAKHQPQSSAPSPAHHISPHFHNMPVYCYGSSVEEPPCSPDDDLESTSPCCTLPPTPSNAPPASWTTRVLTSKRYAEPYTTMNSIVPPHSTAFHDNAALPSWFLFVVSSCHCVIPALANSLPHLAFAAPRGAPLSADPDYLGCSDGWMRCNSLVPL